MAYYNTERCENLAKFIVDNKTTVRTTAKKFGISKSTVHKDVTQKLSKINKPLYDEVVKILEVNKNERHLRGGEATKQKYIKIKNENAFWIIYVSSTAFLAGTKMWLKI